MINWKKSVLHWANLSPCLLLNQVCLTFSVEILRRPREVPEERQLLVDAQVTLVPSGEKAGDQVNKLKAIEAKASESEPKSEWMWQEGKTWQLTVLFNRLKSFPSCPGWSLCLPVCVIFARNKVPVIKTFFFHVKEQKLKLPDSGSDFPGQGDKKILNF